MLDVLDPFLRATPTSAEAERSIVTRKTLLTRCRLLLVEPSPAPDPGPSRRDLEGLVLFSLHHLSPSPTTSSAAPYDRTGLLVPQNPYELVRFVRAGAEVWVWEPWGEVGMGGDERAEEFGAGAGRAGGVGVSRRKEEEAEEGEEGVRVEWAASEGRSAAAWGGGGGGEKSEGTRKGLVCSRFAVLVE